MPKGFPQTLQVQAARTAVPCEPHPALHYGQAQHQKLLLVFQSSAPPYTIAFKEQRNASPARLNFPAGAQLFGICAENEPIGGNYHLLGDHFAWVVPQQDVAVTVLDASYPIVNAQLALAQEHEQQARERFERKDYQEAQRLYAMAAVELIAADISFRSVGQIQMERAIALSEGEAAREVLIEQLEQAAGTYELAFAEWGTRFYGEQIAAAEEASQVQVFLSMQYAFADENQKARRSVTRLLELNKLIKKRYQIKVELLLHAAEILLQLGDSAQAASVVADADRFYQQQLVTQASYNDEVAKIGQRLGRLKAKGRVSIHDIAFVLTADTRDDLEAILSALEGAKVEGLVLPKTTSRVQKGNSARHGYAYTARVRLKRSDDRA